MKKIIIALFLVTAAAFASTLNNYTMDKNHARLGFSVVHMGISNVEGNFKNFDATLKATKEDFSDAVIKMTAEVNSINTEVEMRDKDLKGENWFNAEKYPYIKFKSSSFNKINDNNYELSGDITIKDITKPIKFNTTYNGSAVNKFYNTKLVGFTVTGKLNRSDFGLGAEPLATGVGNEIELKSNIEFTVK